MPNTFTEQTFRSTYKDDFKDSDNYSRILFNAGRALQARELTQMQTIIQKEISRFADNIFQKDGVPVSAGGVSVNNSYAFVKISADQNNSFSNPTALVGVNLTGSSSSIKVKVLEAVPATDGGDPNTLYVQYLDNPSTVSVNTKFKVTDTVTPGETLSNGSNVNFTVQSTNTTANPAVGFGSTISIGESTFYVKGHFVFVPKQTIFLGKYNAFRSEDVGFKLVQDIVTVNDTEALYDNQNVTPNRSSPGADRYRIRLVLIKKTDFVIGESFVYFATVQNGKVIRQVTSTDGYNEVKKFVNTRVKEINGDFIKKYWKLRFEPNANINSNYLMMKIDPGTAYIDGHRAATTMTQSIPLRKAIDTFVDEDEQVGIDYGNFYFFDSGQGMLDIDTAERVRLYSGYDGTGAQIAVGNIRAITEGRNGAQYRLSSGQLAQYQRNIPYKAHLFNLNRTNFNFTIEDVRSIKSAANNDLINLVPTTANQAILHEPRKTALLFDTPLARPKSFTNVSYTFMRKENFTTGVGATTYTLNLTDAGESFVNENDIIIASSTQFPAAGASADIQAGNSQIIFSGLTGNTSYEVILFINKTNASIKTKTLTEATVTASLEEVGNGLQVLNLGKSDIYSIDRVRTVDSNGDDIFPHFSFDAGGQMTHYDDGRLIWSGGGLDSDGIPIFVRFKYFSHSPTGEFFAVNSYSGQLDYLKIPAQALPDGGKVSLRDALDFRPSTDGAGGFTTVPPLPVPTNTIEAKAEYYLPRADKLVISRDGELRLLEGSPSLNPKYPEVPEDCMDLYKIRLNPNTLHARDLKTSLIPRKGYTMADINKLEQKLDRLEEMTTLSLLELNTKFLQVLDSAGLDRTKAGFFVDNFSSHAYSQTKINGKKNNSYRAAIDKRGKLLRPRYTENNIRLWYDSDNTKQLRTVLRDDFVMLDYKTKPFQSQELASGTENLAPFFVPMIHGDLILSPEIDKFYDHEIVGEKILGTKTEFDLTQALNWNNSENEWYGVDPSTLEVGDQARSFISGTSTTQTYDAQDPTLLGSETVVEEGEWVETGHTTDVEVLSTETVEVNRDSEYREVSRTTIDAWWDYMDLWYSDWHREYYNGQWWGWNGYYYGWYYRYLIDEVTTEQWDTVTTETRDTVRTTNTSTYEQTKTITTNNQYEGLAEIITTTTTESTVNRISSESTIRDVVGEKVVEVSAIPFMRPIEIMFKATGLRPNTQYFPFFDKTNVSNFCREEPFITMTSKEAARGRSGEGDDNGTHRQTQGHSAGYTQLIADADGKLEGSFEVPSNVAMRFHTGKREFLLNDVNSADIGGGMSFARAIFESTGTLEHREEEIYITRVLKVVGSTTNDVSRDSEIERTTWTDSVVTTEVAEDVRSTSTTSVITTGTETTEEFIGSEVSYEYSYLNSIQPVDHTDTDQDTTPPGGGDPDNGGGGNQKGSQQFQAELDQSVADQDVLASTHPTPQIAEAERGAYSYGGNDLGMVHHDPLAQTFAVERKSGITITSVEVYFASKSSEAGVRCEIRPTVQGVPSATKVICKKTLTPAQVSLVPTGANNKTMLKNSTTFTFDAPQYLSRGEYAIVLVPERNDTNYNVYVATVGEHAIGSTESFITQQPTMGVLFKSQNNRHWEPSSNQDLAYRINVAQFRSSGNAILENVNIPPVPLRRHSLLMDSGSNQVRVLMQGHGLRTGDIAWIRGIDSAENLGNGLTGNQVIGKRTVVRHDNSGFTYTADATATSRKWFGGSSATSQRNINYEQLRPEVEITIPRGTTATTSIKTTTQSSLAGSETRFVKDAKYQIIENKSNSTFKTPRAIYNRSTENLVAGLNGERSLTMQITMKTVDPFVSPVIDMQSAHVDCVHNLISKQTSGVDATTKTLTFSGYDSGENLNLLLTSTNSRIGNVRINQTYYSGQTIPQGYPSFRRGYVFSSVDGDSDGLVISRSDGSQFSVSVHSSSTGTWSVTDGATSIASTDNVTTISEAANTQLTSVAGFNVPLTYVPETHPNAGTESAKHITKVTTLATDAVGLKVFLAANKPKACDFQLYWRTSTGAESIHTNAWNLVSPAVNHSPDSNKNVFREYQYLIGGEGGNLAKFTSFQLKIVMQSTNSAQVPTFRDLRAIALAV